MYRKKSIMKQHSCFVAELAPKSMMENAPVSIAAHHFCYKLIDNNVFDKAISLAPITYTKKIDNKEADIETISVRYFPNLSIFKLLNTVIESFCSFFKVRKFSFIWFYNINLHTLPLFLLIKYFSRSKPCVILADHTPENSIFKPGYWIGKLMWKSHAILSLSSRTVYAKHNRFACIPGILTNHPSVVSHPDNKQYFLFSGLLGPVTGIELALKVFAKTPDIKLVITGRDTTGIVTKFSQMYPNIDYRGFVSSEEYLLLLANASCCLNFRNPNLPENQNNFPSKLLEYINAGKLIISTMEYTEIKGIDYIISNYDENACIQAVRSAISHLQRNNFDSNTNINLVREICSPDRWKDTINTLSI